MKRFKLVVFDLDGTLIKESCWLILHKHFEVDWGITQKNIEEYARGKINFQELVRKEIALWGKGKKLPHINEIENALESCTLMMNAKETVSKLRSAGYVTALVTYGLDILAEKVSRELGIDHVYSNTLEVDGQGCITGNQFNRVLLGRKNEAVQELSRQLGIPTSEFVAVGDTKYDVSMFKDMGLRIAFNPKHVEITDVADVVVETDDLSQILKFLL